MPNKNKYKSMLHSSNYVNYACKNMNLYITSSQKILEYIYIYIWHLPRHFMFLEGHNSAQRFTIEGCGAAVLNSNLPPVFGANLSPNLRVHLPRILPRTYFWPTSHIFFRPTSHLLPHPLIHYILSDKSSL